MKERKYTYDAFISYRHLEKDKAVAMALQKKLESFVPPKAVRPENFRKWRVFRDETELYSSNDLSEKIKEALNESKYFIAICSEETKHSRWCIQEIQHFKKLHNGKSDRIITVLVDGTPETAFPDELLSEVEFVVDEHGNNVKIEKKVEPLAANLIANDKKQLFKKLDKEFLRIATPMLGCTYDQLYNRTQKRKMQRIIALSSSIIAVLLVFLLVVGSLYLRLQFTNKELMATKISLEEEQVNLKEAMAELVKKTSEANENLQLAIENEKKANENAAEAERQRAVAVDNAETARLNMILARNNEERANKNAKETKKKNIEILTSQAELYLDNQDYTNAIKTALALMPGGSAGATDRNPQAERVIAEATGAYSTGEKYLTASLELDDIVEEVHLSKDGERLAAIAGDGLYVIDTCDGRVIKRLDMKELFKDHPFTSISERDICIENSTLYLLANHQLICVDMDKAEVKWHFNKNMATSLVGKDIITHSASGIIFLSYADNYTILGKDGEVVDRKDKAAFYSDKKNTRMDSEGNIYIADSVHGYITKIYPYEGKLLTAPLGWNSHDYSIFSAAENEKYFYVNCYPYSDYVQTAGKLFCYDKESLEEKWAREYTGGKNSGKHSLHSYKGAEGELVIAVLGSAIIRFDAETGYVKKKINYDTWPGVIDFAVTQNGYAVFYENKITETDLSANRSKTKLQLDTGTEVVVRSDELTALGEGGLAVAEPSSSGIEIYTEAIGNNRAVAFAENIGFVGATAHNNKGKAAIYNYTYASLVRSDEIIVYDAVNNKLLSRTEVPAGANDMQMVFCDNDRLLVTQEAGSGKTMILDAKGKILFESDIEKIVKGVFPEEDYILTYNPEIYTEGNTVVYCTNGGRIFFDTDTLNCKVEWNTNAAFNYHTCRSGRRVYTASYYKDKKEGIFYHNGKEEKMIFECKPSEVSALDLSLDGTKVAFTVKGGIRLYDDKNKTMGEIPLAYGESDVEIIRFTPDGESLIAMHNNSHLVNYSVKTGEAVGVSEMLKEYASLTDVEFIDEATMAVKANNGGLYLLDSATMEKKAFIEGGYHYIKGVNKLFCEQEGKGILYEYLDTAALIKYAKKFIGE